MGVRPEAGGPPCQPGPGREHGRRQGPFTPSIGPRTPVAKGNQVPAHVWEDTRGRTGFPEPGNPQASEDGVLCGFEDERLAPESACDGSGRCWGDAEGQEGAGPLAPFPAPPPHLPPQQAEREGETVVCCMPAQQSREKGEGFGAERRDVTSRRS